MWSVFEKSNKVQSPTVTCDSAAIAQLEITAKADKVAR
ncbi:hypothetical protein EVA_09390 [gut metagenome]|uniref:Uncharacterized protein n=1 Tax=gut metagenome TaxID=749906 RepID=J9G5J5_9ZZZZ